ncbi:phosphodiester glycosidase family protein [Clostridium weizhouense]|uniref:Phosphodiester glycosidase family protein n=1 Tax=Clostridium weizhouense TaxID=2859781 RepID=A0ABS7AU02_9CLOT|nr:phosphodiester glycosidase family protein [Clostridium weizhouense]MBW6411241.1 phosphodiester glycosidase family protein [Clostridium weizhouense]
MDKNIKKKKRPVKPRQNNGKRKKKRVSLKNLVIFIIFMIIFTACTGPFVLLYGPFENAKRTYVGAAMTSLSHQYLAKWFLSDEKIAEILGGSSVASSENTNTDEIEIPKIKDPNIELNEIDNPKYKGYLLIIKDPTRVKVGYTSKLKKEGETTSQIAENNNAIAAINGGGFTDKSSNAKWTGNGGLPIGLIMNKGEVVYNDLGEDNKTDLLGMTKEGKLIVGNYSVNQLRKMGVQEALSFTPTLVVNGKMTPMSGDGGWGIAPRTVIGQRRDGAILLLVIDGRSVNSLGATLKEAQEIIYQCGAVNAINLDGGKSTTMYYNGDIVNTPSDSLGERAIPTAIIVE